MTKYSYNEKRKEWYTLVYDGTLTETGAKHRRRITSKKSSKDLERKIAEFKAALETDVVPSMITFGEYSRKWLSLYKSNKELNTQTMYKNALLHFAPIDDKRLSDITRSDFQYIINLKADHPRTCIIISQTFKQIIKSAVYDGYLPENSVVKLTTGVSMPKYQKSVKMALSEAERNAILNCDLNEKQRALVTILYYCGLRKGEVLALTKSDIDFEKKTLTVNKSIIFDGNTPILKPYPKSDNSIRTVVLCEPCISILQPYVANCTFTLFPSENSPYFTSTVYKNTWRSIQKSFNEYEGTGNLTAHRLRHNFCSLLCYQVPKVSTKTIARILGDTEQMVLNVYSHILEDKEDINGALEAAFQG